MLVILYHSSFKPNNPVLYQSVGCGLQLYVCLDRVCKIKIQNATLTLRTHNQFCTTEKLCNHRSLTWEFRQKNNDRQMNGELR